MTGEEKQLKNIFSVENCWLNAQASFEWGYCPSKFKEEFLSRFTHVFDRIQEAKTSKEPEFSSAVSTAFTSFSTAWRDNIGDKAKDFMNTVLLPDNPTGLLDGSIWTDILSPEDAI